MNFNTFEDCSNLLQTLLNQAHDAVTDGDVQKKVAAQKSLKDFIDNCVSPKADELDDIATQAINNIFEATLDKALAEIGSRTAELASLTKSINAVTDAANRDAASIRLDRARKVIDTTLGAVDALKNLRQSLKSDQPDERQLADSITALINTIQSVRNQIETLNH
jgi:hypothetical protein